MSDYRLIFALFVMTASSVLFAQELVQEPVPLVPLQSLPDVQVQPAPLLEEPVADGKPGEKEIKVFMLKFADASTALQIIERLYQRPLSRMSVDERTNALIVHGEKSFLNEIETLLLRLDEPGDDNPLATSQGIITFDYFKPEVPVNDLRIRFDEQEQRSREISLKIRSKQQAPNRNQDDEDKLRADLRQAVQEAFKARQELQRAELAQFTQRLQHIQQSIETRERIADQIIDHRVEELLNPALQWDGQKTTAMPAPGLDAAHSPMDPTEIEESLAIFKGSGTGGANVGVISKVREDGRVVISQIEPNSIKTNEELEVLRPNPDAEGQWIAFAYVQVLYVSPTFAVARVIASLRELKDGKVFEFEKVQVGNHISRPNRTAKLDEDAAIDGNRTDDVRDTRLRTPDEFRTSLLANAQEIAAVKETIANLQKELKLSDNSRDADADAHNIAIIQEHLMGLRRVQEFAKEEYAAQLKLLQLDCDSAELDSRLANSDYERLKKLSEKGAIPVAKLTEAAREANETKNRVHRAQILLELYEKAGEGLPLDLDADAPARINPAEANGNEADASLIGLWDLDYLPADAELVPLERRTRTVVTERQWAIFEGDRLKEKFSYRVNKSVTPHRVWLIADGIEKLRGIYQIEGDKMSLSIAFADAAFPTQFNLKQPKLKRSSVEIPTKIPAELLKQLE